MKSVIDQSLRDVLDFHIGGGLELTTIDDTLVRDEVTVPLVKRREIRFESFRDIIGTQDRYLSCVPKTIAAHEGDVHPRDGENTGATPGRRGYRTNTLRTADFSKWMLRQIRSQMPRDSDRPHARTTAAVRDAKRLVQVEVANVGADV